MIMSSMMVFLQMWYDLGRKFIQSSCESSMKESMSFCDLILSWECTKNPPDGEMISGNCFLSHTPCLVKSSHGVMSIILWSLESVELIESSSWVEKRLCLGEVILVEFKWLVWADLVEFLWGLEWLEGVSVLTGGVTWWWEVEGDCVSLGNLAVVKDGEWDDLWLGLLWLELLWLELIFGCWSL